MRRFFGRVGGLAVAAASLPACFSCLSAGDTVEVRITVEDQVNLSEGGQPQPVPVWVAPLRGRDLDSALRDLESKAQPVVSASEKVKLCLLQAGRPGEFVWTADRDEEWSGVGVVAEYTHQHGGERRRTKRVELCGKGDEEEDGVHRIHVVVGRSGLAVKQ